MLEPSIVKDEEVEYLIKDVYDMYGYDFSEYSRASFKRRVNRICLIDRFTSFAELRYTILNDPEYLKRFIEEITVNVTEMFRDPQFFKALREKILPQLGTYPLIRIWVAGCSTGEEAYSMAILLKEANLYHKSLIYGTDLNPSVLETARAGVFPLQQMKLYSENYILSGGKKDFSDYYTANYDSVKFDKSLQEKLILSTHNLVSDSSFNSFQLIICRNVLIYFDRGLQERVFRLFDNSLENLGFLALGAKETLRFSKLDKNYNQVDDQKIWKKVDHQ
ncbi:MULTISPECIES: CheR family methyltransferase [Chryseobacterium]|jgi:chemotaxis protein methyltransferase CheR|uniref:Protein-glutamate O-methyltransferase CheR n=2 Tax=Chryseobacterium TaxID=59732 RepID=A0AAJ1QZZ1_9FLAO|nr:MULTISPECIES: protein-glutamate O-methyltransferase CheR [Chryseobacterium]NPA09941.1 protein-glutamate O-methyltransferase CheR [Chlorobiota bacterium]MCF2219334.1 protein-glutamate O-methyltransferase CheR [Chryseobacterium sp. PS-8]MCQ4141832.1 protein-glutamate O-methyltransferase CheR [Chryseobacterium sp. EO14]MDN4010935.1 protein-glutamate O-methyltransferase CheR [Chryseobacterium gambrini]MDN4028451.1 protein-glutamate O-methyltransferase CheR [Chryseobacterium gambrini]